MINKKLRYVFLSLLLLGISAQTFSQNIKVAIAANLQPVMKALQKDFKKQSGITVDAISGPSGNLATQIRNGAPFDVFLSADTNFPDNLYKSGDALGKPVVYARGVLIIGGKGNLTYKNWVQLLVSAKVQKVAIGNPAIAPYGKAAKEALEQAKIYASIQPKIVMGESISQVNTYIATGAVQVGFTTLAFVKEAQGKFQLNYAIVDPKTYAPIEQGMVILKHAKGNTTAQKFYQYILSPDAKKIFKAYGYHMQ